jgi:hypothetical protein
METAMDFEHSTKVRALQSRLQAFMAEHIYPSERRYQEEVRSGDRWQPTEVIETEGPRRRAVEPVSPAKYCYATHSLIHQMILCNAHY